MKKILCLLLLLCGITAFSQTDDEVAVIENAHEECLDKGEDILACSILQYKQMDALLSVVYDRLRSNLVDPEKSELKKEQLLWLRKRDQYVQVQYKKIAEELGSVEGDDFKMMVKDKQTEFVKERILALKKKEIKK